VHRRRRRGDVIGDLVTVHGLGHGGVEQCWRASRSGQPQHAVG